MTTIPERIMEEARALAEREVGRMCLTWDHSFGLMDESQREGLRRSFAQIAQHHLEPLIAESSFAAEQRGREMERAECAKLCEEFEVGTSTREGQVVHRSRPNRRYTHAGDGYAAAIRSRSEGKGSE